MPVSVLYPQNRQLSARVRVFADWLSEVFAPFNVRG
jgi:DNA-binding transcriptional LysR family regulator